MTLRILTLVVVSLIASGCGATLHQAAERGDVEGVRAILDARPERASEPDERSLTPLHYAASEGELETVSLLLERGADPNRAALGGISAVFVAAAGGHAEVVERLLDGGAESSGRTPWNPMRVAAAEGYDAVVRALLDRGADPEGHNIPPLLAAAAGGHVSTMALLVKAGAKVNRVTLDDFSSALTVAAARGQIEAVRWLLSHGADASHDDKLGRTAQMRAKENGHPRVADIISEHVTR